MSLKQDLIDGKKSIGIIGAGFIGFSTAYYFSREGIKTTIYDVNKATIDKINARETPTEDLAKWLGTGANFDMIFGTTRFEDLKDCNPLFIAVPTEKQGSPWFDAIEGTFKKIHDDWHKNKLIIIESTLGPGTCDDILIPLLSCGNKIIVAPRRDWHGFGDDKSKTLPVLPRVVGGLDKESTLRAVDVLSIVCKILLPCYYREAELVKAVENTIRNLEINFCNQLMLAYPSINVRKVLKMVGSKWNMPTIYPHLAPPGGYCINMAPRYVYDGAENKGPLTLLRASMMYEPRHTHEIMSRIVQKFHPEKIAVLGYAYMGNIKVDTTSAAKDIITFIEAEAIPYAVHDPLYTREELETQNGLPYLNYPEDLDDFDMVILTVGHNEYKVQMPEFTGIVIDVPGIWKKWKKRFGGYVLVGEPF